MSAAVVACVAIVAAPTSLPAFGSFQLPVGLQEGPGVVRLRVYVPDGVPDSSLEVEIVGPRRVRVSGRDRNGVPIRSREIAVSQTVSTEGAEAEFSADGALVITLHATSGKDRRRGVPLTDDGD